MKASRDPLPSPWPAMWRLLKIGIKHEPGLLSLSLLLVLLAALPDALIALWVKYLGDGILAGNGRLIIIAALALALSATGTWAIRLISGRVQNRFRDKITIVLEGHVATLQAGIPTVAHQEVPVYLDRLAVLRDEIYVLDHMYASALSSAGWILRLGVTLALLASIDARLGLLLLAALPTALVASWRPAAEHRVLDQVASRQRLAAHLYQTLINASTAKEVRVLGIGQDLAAKRRQAWEGWYGPVAASRWTTAFWNALAWAIFAGAFMASVYHLTLVEPTPLGNILLLLTAGARLAAYIGGTVSEIGYLRGTWMDGAQRLAWLEDYAAGEHEAGKLAAPETLADGIRVEGLSFAYPGSEKLVLDGIDLHFEPGSVVAIVGENGAGKSTLVKLLTKLYAPSKGRILVGGQDLRDLDSASWRGKLSGAFQDFFKFEFKTQHAVGLGDLAKMDDRPAVARAVNEAGADDLLARLPRGLDTQLGAAWPEGVELSFGQWQKLAVARGFMRPTPLLLILDEPTAALDAETESGLFERYAQAARKRKDGRITILISHRFSTVRIADKIVVLDGSRLVETGSHAELMAKAGRYADLYRIQAKGYQ